MQRGNPMLSGALHILERIPVRLKDLGTSTGVVAGLSRPPWSSFLRTSKLVAAGRRRRF